MKRIGIFLLSGLFGLFGLNVWNCAAQVSPTPNLGMTLPVQNSPNWGVVLNSNFTIIDTFAGTSKITWPASGSLVISSATNTPTGLAEADGLCAVGAAGVWTTGACGTGSVAFSAVTGGTNTNALVVGTGGSLAASGSGTINATSINGNTFPAGAGLVAGQFVIPSSITVYGLSGVNLTYVSPDLTIGVAGATTGQLTLASSTATGSVTLQSASAASAFTVTIPAATDTLANLAGAQTLTNKTLTAPTISSPVLTGTPNASGAAQFKLPVASGYASLANGELGYDSTGLNWHIWGNGVDNISVLVPVSVTVVNGDCVEWTKVGAVISLGDTGSACGSGGGGGSAFSAITNGTNTTAAMVVGTGASLAASGSGTITATSAATVLFSGVTAATNTAALVVGTGGSLSVSGSGVINANQVNSNTFPANGALIANQLVMPTSSSAYGLTGTALTFVSPTLTIGVAGSTTGILTLASSTATGSVSLQPASAASAFTVTIPAATDILANLGSAQTLTNKTLTSPIISSPTLTGTPDASGASQFKLPVAANYTSAANGELGYDSTNKNWHIWGNGVDNLGVVVPASVSITNGDCVQWTKVSNVITVSDTGTPCGSSGGGTAFSSLTNGTNTGAAMVVGTGASLGTTGSGTITATSAAAVLFSGVGAATNTNALVIGTGGSLTISGSGTINATSVNSNTFPASAGLTSGQFIIPSSSSAYGLSGVNLTYSSPTLTIGVAGTTTGILKLASSTATGSISLTPASAASAFTVTVPAATDTLVNLASSQTLTSKTLTSPVLGGTPDASGATQFKLPVAASGASLANGEKIYDTTNLNWHTWGNGVDNLEVIIPVSVTVTNGHCMQWVNVAGVITASDSGSACGSGGGGTAFSSLTNGTNTAAAMVVGTGASLGVSGSGTIAATSAPFSGVSAGTNANALVIGTGGSLGTSGSGSITATAVAVGGITGLGSGVATWLATPSSANLAAAVTGATGSGALVFGTSPTFVTPALGTPSSGVITNLTGTCTSCTASAVPVGGITGLGTGVATWLATPSSANLLSALTTKTGTGLAVFATSPTFLGTPDASGATQFKLPIASGYVSAANGELGYDTTNSNWHIWGNATDNFIAIVPVTTAPVNNDCVKWVSVANVVTLGDAGTTCGGGGGGGSSWSALTNPSGALTLSMGIFATTFQYSSALAGAFQWQNTTVATSSTSASSPLLYLCGNAWHAAASAQDCLTVQDQPGIGTDAGITFNFAHLGSSTGVVTSAFPGPVQAGPSGGTGGTLLMPEGTAALGVASQDICYADTTTHSIKCSFNNGPFLPMVISATSVVSGDAPSYNGTAGGLLQDSGVSLTGGSVNITSGQCFAINNDTFLSRANVGIFFIGTACGGSQGQLGASDLTVNFKISTLFTQHTGTTFTTNAGCTDTALTGGGTGGNFTVGTSIACSTVITMGAGATATHGWVCKGVDATTKTDTVTIVPTSVTSVTLSGTFLSGDKIWFACDAV